MNVWHKLMQCPQTAAHARLIIIVSNMAVIKEIAVNACIIFREDARPFIIAVRE